MLCVHEYRLSFHQTLAEQENMTVMMHDHVELEPPGRGLLLAEIRNDHIQITSRPAWLLQLAAAQGVSSHPMPS